jgi:hypothetical protein
MQNPSLSKNYNVEETVKKVAMLASNAIAIYGTLCVNYRRDWTCMKHSCAHRWHYSSCNSWSGSIQSQMDVVGTTRLNAELITKNEFK